MEAPPDLQLLVGKDTWPENSGDWSWGWLEEVTDPGQQDNKPPIMLC